MPRALGIRCSKLSDLMNVETDGEEVDADVRTVRTTQTQNPRLMTMGMGEPEGHADAELLEAVGVGRQTT